MQLFKHRFHASQISMESNDASFLCDVWEKMITLVQQVLLLPTIFWFTTPEKYKIHPTRITSTPHQ